MIRKIIKNSSKKGLLLYAVIWGLCCPSYAAESAGTVEEGVSAEEMAISSLKDPFDPSVQAPGLIEYLMQGMPSPKDQQPKLPEASAVVEIEPPPPLPIPSAEAVQMPSMVVSGIVFKTKNPLAIVNGKVVGVGDIVDEVKILKIGKGRIDVQYQGVESFVQFNNE